MGPGVGGSGLPLLSSSLMANIRGLTPSPHVPWKSSVSTDHTIPPNKLYLLASCTLYLSDSVVSNEYH